MRIYVFLDEKKRLEYFSYGEPVDEGYIEVDTPKEHPIIALGRVNYRYEDGEWIEDNSVYEEWLAEQEKANSMPSEEDRLTQLENAMLAMMMMQ